MSTIINKKQILNELKEYYSFKNDLEFAKFLGIAPTTLSSWYSRNTFNWDLIFAKCVEIDFDFLIRKGKAKKKEKIKENISDQIIKQHLDLIVKLSAENALLKERLSSLKNKNSGYGLAAESGINE